MVYVALALATIAVGLWVHRGGAGFGPVARDVVGDALWSTMILWWFGALMPHRSVWWRGTAALTVCVLVELSQLLHTEALDAVRQTSVGHLVLGSGFDLRDLVAYTIGILIAAVAAYWIERVP